MELILMIVAFGAIMYFLMIRPQQKRVKEHQALINSIQPGTRVLLTSGIFATVRHMGERQIIAELSPGNEVTMMKGNIAKVVTPQEEEFEFSEDTADSVDAIDGIDGIADNLDPSQFLDQPSGFDQPESFDPRPESVDQPESDAPESETKPEEGDKA